MQAFRPQNHDRESASEGWESQTDAGHADAVRGGERAVDEAGEGTETEERDAPERHHAPALRVLDLELEPARRRGVGREVAEACDDEQRAGDRQPATDRETDDPEAEHAHRQGHTAARARNPAREEERRADRAG